jgi:hypothetical protein
MARMRAGKAGTNAMPMEMNCVQGEMSLHTVLELKPASLHGGGPSSPLSDVSVSSELL